MAFPPPSFPPPEGAPEAPVERALPPEPAPMRRIGEVGLAGVAITPSEEPRPTVRINMGRRAPVAIPDPTTPTVKINMGRRAPAPATWGAPTTPIGVTSAEATNPAELAKIQDLLGLGVAELTKTYSYRTALSGDLNMEGGYTLSSRAASEHPYRTDLHGRIPTANGFSKALETGADIGELVRKAPFDRHKFYLSLDLSTPEKKERANAFMSEVHAGAVAQKIAMLTKPEDHNYDSCNIYTWSPTEMSAIIDEAYARYPDIWQSVIHPMQGPVGSTNRNHVGIVQEPILGAGAGSHSDRARTAGITIDEQGGLTSAKWANAAQKAGVQKDAPWLVDPALKPAYLMKLSESTLMMR